VSSKRASSSAKLSRGYATGTRQYGGLKDNDRIFTNLYNDGSPFLDGALKRVRCSNSPPLSFFSLRLLVLCVPWRSFFVRSSSIFAFQSSMASFMLPILVISICSGYFSVLSNMNVCVALLSICFWLPLVCLCMCIRYLALLGLAAVCGVFDRAIGTERRISLVRVPIGL